MALRPAESAPVVLHHLVLWYAMATDHRQWRFKRSKGVLLFTNAAVMLLRCKHACVPYSVLPGSLAAVRAHIEGMYRWYLQRCHAGVTSYVPRTDQSMTTP
jgi:hypothetical protein